MRHINFAINEVLLEGAVEGNMPWYCNHLNTWKLMVPERLVQFCVTRQWNVCVCVL